MAFQMVQMVGGVYVRVCCAECLHFLRIKEQIPCAFIEGDKVQTMIAWEHIYEHLTRSFFR